MVYAKYIFVNLVGGCSVGFTLQLSKRGTFKWVF